MNKYYDEINFEYDYSDVYQKRVRKNSAGIVKVAESMKLNEVCLGSALSVLLKKLERQGAMGFEAPAPKQIVSPHFIESVGEKIKIESNRSLDVRAPVLIRSEVNCAKECRKSELHYESCTPLLLGGSGRGKNLRTGVERRNRGKTGRQREKKKNIGKSDWSLSRNLMTSGPAPPHMVVTMPYTSTILFSSTTSFLVYDFRMNNITQVDPLISGSAAAGAASWSEVYSQYNIKGFRIRYNFVTNETSTAQVLGFTFKDYQPTVAITSLLLAEQSLGLAPTTGPRGIGETTGSSVYRSPWYSIPPSVVLGNKLQYFAEKDFTGNFTTGPLQTLWASFILYNPIIANVSGTLTVMIEFLVHLYSASPNLITLVRRVDALSLDDQVVFEQ